MKPAFLLSCLMALVAPCSLSAQVGYTGEGSEYSESFNQLARSGSVGWEDSRTVPGWRAYFTRSGTPQQYVAYDGNASAGGLRSFGIIGSGERALGVAPGSHYGDAMIGVVLINEAGRTLDEMTISYVGQLWRGVGAGGKELKVEYRIGGPEELSEGEWQPIDELTFHAPHGEANMAYDGTLPENSEKLTATVSGIQWKSGGMLYLRFVQSNDERNKHFAIDHFVLSAR